MGTTLANPLPRPAGKAQARWPPGRDRPFSVPVVRLVLLHLLLAGWAGTATRSLADVGIEDVLSRMSAEKRRFNPEALRKEGVAGLSRLLDRLLPQTAKRPRPSLSKAEAAKFVRQLGHDHYRVRENATRTLTNKAEPFRELVEQAARDPDLEVAIRAALILIVWDAKRQALLPTDASQYADAFSAYLDGLADKAMLSELARRTRLALQSRSLSEGQRRVLSHCLAALARSGKDRYTDPLIPLLGHDDVSIAVWVTSTVGSRSRNRYFPRLLLEALKSKRERVVDAALSWTPNCWDRSKSAQVKRLVTAIFEGDNEKLKFHACFSMMHSYADKRAINYLLSQTNSPDKARARRAISWIADACNTRKKAFPRLLEQLGPLLKSKDKELRRMAADALRIYQGQQIVDALIPLLGDPEDIIRSEVSSNLLDQRDKSMLKARLADAARNAHSHTVRAKAKELLSRLAEGRQRRQGGQQDRSTSKRTRQRAQE